MKRSVALFLLVCSVLALAVPAAAHPLGNYTTNLHLGVHVDGDTADVLLVVDMAEIPTFREDVGSDLAAYAQDRCVGHADDVSIATHALPLALGPATSAASFADGEGGLRTLRLECRWTVAIPSEAATVSIRNDVHADRTGWAETVVTGAASDAPEVSPTSVLLVYPDGAPEVVRTAVVELVANPAPTTDDAAEEAPAVTAAIGGWLETAGSAGGLVAVLAALALGVTHALAPGHGKTLMAAYLVGRRGTSQQAAGLGLAVAVSHTIGVGVLGVVTAIASTRFQPESVYPWLTTGSALVVTGLGVTMLVRALKGRRRHHHHDDGTHDHHHHHEAPADLGWRSLAALGLAGGLVPSASAVVLLLGAVAIGRPWFGVLLVFAFGVGMSIALVGAGIVALRLTTAGLRRLEDRIPVPTRLVPALAGAAVTVVGGILLWGAAPTLL